MKIKAFFSFSVLILLILGSCKKDASNVKKVVTIVPDNAVTSYIKSLGYQNSEITDIGADYLVDGDILFSKTSKISVQDSSKSKLKVEQYGTSNYVGLYNNVVIQIDPSMNNYVNLITDAIAQWNNVPNCRINFSIYNGSSPSNLTIINSNLGNGYCGQAYFPINGNPGAQVKINLTFLAPSYTSNQIESVIIHELGHTIGFRHTNWKALSEPLIAQDPNTFARAIATQILGTPTGDDVASIMNGGTCGNSSIALSDYDKIAVQFIYPLNSPVAGSVPVFRYCSTRGDHFYSTDYSELGNGNNNAYIFEGVAFFVFNTAVSDSVPIYRYNNPTTGDHYYTQVYGAYSGYNYEGIRFYAFASQINGSVPIYGYFDGKYHFDTKNSNEPTPTNLHFELNAFYAY